jgi:hypothetical protein
MRARVEYLNHALKISVTRNNGVHICSFIFKAFLGRVLGKICQFFCILNVIVRCFSGLESKRKARESWVWAIWFGRHSSPATSAVLHFSIRGKLKMASQASAKNE